ncbi:MAG: ZIP family metal transporter [Alphaproteobacteria bacterium]|nr:ZIP family metal transporter [Alphaproteobacteria bacterium]
MHSLPVFVFALFTALITMAGGVLALRLKSRLPLVLGFSAGAVVGVAFFDLLPEAFRLGGGDNSLTVGAAALGFFLYAMVDRFAGHDHNCHDDPHRGVMGAATFSFHSLLDGLAMGLAFQVSRQAGLVVAAAVLAHDFADGLNTVNVVTRHGASRGQALRWLAADAAAPLLGACLSLLLSPAPTVMGLVLAGFGGFFLYIGACDLLPASQRAKSGLVTMAATFAGAGFLYLATRLAA